MLKWVFAIAVFVPVLASASQVVCQVHTIDKGSPYEGYEGGQALINPETGAFLLQDANGKKQLELVSDKFVSRLRVPRESCQVKRELLVDPTGAMDSFSYDFNQCEHPSGVSQVDFDYWYNFKRQLGWFVEKVTTEDSYKDWVIGLEDCQVR